MKLNLGCWIFYQEGYVNIDRNRVFDESTLRICTEAVGFINIAAVDNHEAIIAPSSALGWQLALEGYKPMRLRTEGRVRRQRSQDVVTHCAQGVAASR